MANTFNAITTGTGGVATSGDSSGTFAFASNGTTVATISATGAMTLGAALPVASGGTGAATLTANNVLLGNGTSAVQVVAPGTSGNVLTSNGTTWSSTALPAGGVTSLNGQTGAITDTNLYAIGSYVNGRPANYTSYSVNTTVAGSSLYATNTGDVYQSFYSGWVSFAAQSFVNTGTWRCVSPAYASGGTDGYSGLWVRIS